ncbi:ABC transporter ATP-binding protein [candidate division KSB1 bacterium]|nr:ABC transporter ATP-binding protein [candidate division KSB1 bacterium]RQW11394.1 MAG: ABC transporter ATP-binding protein [candidate division KSB1 bacterium]
MKITIQDLNKRYKNGFSALKNIDLEINDGLFGLLGPNGAGKTTFMRILVTLMKPSSGIVTVDQFDLMRHRRQIRAMLGYLPQDFSVFTKLSTWEFLDYVAALAGLTNGRERKRAVDEMLEKVGLYDARDRRANKLSGGMKRRLGIAQALIGNPKIVVVDEPTTGLDPEERIRFRNLLSDMTHREIIIILSTHIVSDISSTCNRMALLNKGELIFNDAPEKLIAQAKGHVFQINALDSDLEAIKAKYPVITTIPSTKGWDVQVVADKLDDFYGTEIEPNLEHAYVYRMEYGLEN